MDKFLYFMLVSWEEMRSTPYANLLCWEVGQVLSYQIVNNFLQENDFQPLTNQKCVLYL